MKDPVQHHYGLNLEINQNAVPVDNFPFDSYLHAIFEAREFSFSLTVDGKTVFTLQNARTVTLESGGAVLLEQMLKDANEAHELRQQLEDAKAVIRKILPR